MAEGMDGFDTDADMVDPNSDELETIPLWFDMVWPTGLVSTDEGGFEMSVADGCRDIRVGR